MKEYPQGNEEVLKMIEEGRFDVISAKRILKGIDLNKPICTKSGVSTTYLYEAVSNNNLQATAFFLDNGADPNFYDISLTCDCALWELQYIQDDQDWKTRYEIAKLFFEHGANPNLECEGESLYDYIVFKVYNDIPNNDNDWENLRHFYKLLVIYGGGRENGGYRKPKLKNIDLKSIDDYDIELSRHEDGFHIVGVMIDKDGTELGNL